ncbi:MAG: histidine triad nucleotide-binding protein [Syntrophales bacterium LBB04]|nr:histidine triad nucleotide-binding protein [Syntrophales bacterium LBB04]
MDDCIFCKIIKGEIPASKVYEDEKVLAFDDINPMAPIHVVVIPKEHISTLMDVTAKKMDCIGAMMAAAQKIAGLKGIDQKGFRVVINCNYEAGQVIFHLHMHVLGGRKLGAKLC